MNADPENYGIIHGDLHLENIIFDGNEAFPIDFGRCGKGNYLADIASTLLGISGDKRKIFLDGYQSEKKIEADYESKLETMLIKIMIENYSHHASNPLEKEGLIAEQPYAQAIIKKYLNNESFLFQPLTPVEVL
jgi:Ser/Thr protein kinase RdoA (MazF antagonist)